MKSMLPILFVALAGLLFCSTRSQAHTPYMACYDNGDGSVSCYAEFSDGSSAAGNPVRVTDEKGKLLTSGVIDETGEFSFKRPQQPFTVTFDAGPGHVVTEKSSTIGE
jgi:hypothetical protein